MGIGSAIAAVAGVVGSAISSHHAAKKEREAARQAEIAQREAALRDVQVGRQGEDPSQTVSAAQQVAEESSQNAARRRRGLSSTTLRGSLVSSLAGSRSKLGGL